jgi:hypothetical protein
LLDLLLQINFGVLNGHHGRTSDQRKDVWTLCKAVFGLSPE